MRWKYKVTTTITYLESTNEEHLNEHGINEWELVDVKSLGDKGLMYFWKKQGRSFPVPRIEHENDRQRK